jgi:hypothetical protein
MLAMADGTFADRVRRVFDSTKRTVGDAAEGAGAITRKWWASARENVRLSRPEYLRRADERLLAASAQLTKIKGGTSGVMGRKYFQLRLAALEEHLLHAHLELSGLQGTPTEETFRQKQTPFDFTLWSLEEALELSLAEAGY